MHPAAVARAAIRRRGKLEDGEQAMLRRTAENGAASNKNRPEVFTSSRP